MADIGVELKEELLFLTTNRDFKSELEYIDIKGVSGPWPPGDLFLELKTTPALTEWHYSLSGSTATLLVTAATADTIPDEIGWQLVWRPTGDTGSGEAVALGCLVRQTACCD